MPLSAIPGDSQRNAMVFSGSGNVRVGLILRHYLPTLRGIGPRGIEQGDNIPGELNALYRRTSINGRTELEAVLSLEGASIP